MKADHPFIPARNAEPAEWMVDRLTDFAVNVLSIIPSGFEAYARVFHPAFKVTCTSDEAATAVSEPLRWSKVAELTGRTPHKLMQWPSIQGANPGLHDYTVLKAGDAYVEAPEGGNLPAEVAGVLWPILEQYTSTPDVCFFAIWEGFGGLPKFIHEAPAFEIPARRFYLFEAPLQTIEQSFYTGAGPDDMSEGVTVLVATADDPAEIPSPEEIQATLRALPVPEFPILHQSANLWWPKDRAWCVATEIDFNTTYVAGSQALINAVLESDALEAHQVEPTDKITYDSDTLNPTPGDPYGGSFKIK